MQVAGALHHVVAGQQKACLTRRQIRLDMSSQRHDGSVQVREWSHSISRRLNNSKPLLAKGKLSCRLSIYEKCDARVYVARGTDIGLYACPHDLGFVRRL